EALRAAGAAVSRLVRLGEGDLEEPPRLSGALPDCRLDLVPGDAVYRAGCSVAVLSVCSWFHRSFPHLAAVSMLRTAASRSCSPLPPRSAGCRRQQLFGKGGDRSGDQSPSDRTDPLPSRKAVVWERGRLRCAGGWASDSAAAVRRWLRAL